VTVRIKTPEQIEGIRIAAQIAADCLVSLNDVIKPGITTDDIDKHCSEFIAERGATATSLHYKGFPKSVCTSVNHVICHGIPGDKKLKKGDIINVDIAVTKDGYIGDTSKMYKVGKTGILANQLCMITYDCMQQGIAAVAPGEDIRVVGRAIEKHLKLSGLPYSLVREYCGHGVGIEFHEDPQILHFAYPDSGNTFLPGMVFTIEPMINAGKPQTKQLPDGWTVVTKDHSLSAQWEHTILVTEDGFEILSLREEELEKWSGTP
jgi:methionyl aminopeptidase